ncbi:MAG: hypothetical protein FWE25_10575 [Lachnospiraceae bacterium]|nr:hypothetical protein [Lachnospiraceae bacterium]
MHIDKHRHHRRSYTISQIPSDCDPKGKAIRDSRRHDRRKARAISGYLEQAIGAACSPRPTGGNNDTFALNASQH